MSRPRKQPSGAAKRKARAAKSEALSEAREQVTQQWAATKSSSSITKISREQFDPNGPAIELPVYGVPPVTLVSAVNSALVALEQGQFFAASYLWDGMTRDDRVKAKVEERVDALVGAELQFEPAKDTARARNIAEDCEEQLPQMLPQHAVGKMLRYGRVFSVAIGQVQTRRTPQATYPTLYVWNNRWLRWDFTIRRYCLVTQNRGEIALEPDDPEWVIYEPYGPNGWRDSAIIRSISTPWLIRYWARTWWARHQEVHGQPIRLGIIPAERNPSDERLFLSQLANLAHEAVIRLPQGVDGNKFDVKLLEAAANTWEGFEKLLAHCDDSIAIAFLGQKQSTNGQGGLGSQKDAGEESILRITRSDALVYVDLRNQVLKPWAADNYGDEDMAPYPCPQIEPPEDESEVSKTDLTIGQALMAFKTAGAPVDQRKYLESRGYGELLMSEEEHAAAKQEAMEAAQKTAQVAADDSDKPVNDAESKDT
jgi:phage gp29-like protein